MSNKNKFSITGLGACGEVGRSAFLLDFGEKFLLDYGIKLSSEEVEYPLEVNEHVKAVVVSHAHLDHAGLLPYFYKKSSSLNFMTQSTLELADILWKDSIKIAEFDGVEPKYNRSEIERAHKHNFSVPYNKKIMLGNDLSLEFFDAGHILGSALTKFTFKEKNFLYTGDYKVEETQLHAGCELEVGEVDYLMVESTYGDREQANRKLEEKAFCESIQSTIERGGWALVPVLAIGRSQEVINILSKYNIDAPIYFDGMAKQASEVYFKHPELLKDPKGLRKALNSVEWIMNKQGRNQALKKPGVIVSTSGMMHGGPIMHYVKRVIGDPRSKIHLTSYQAEGTPGRALLDKGVFLDEDSGSIVKVGCRYEKFDFSAHPSQSELIKSIKKWNPKEVFMVHGDKKVMNVFSKEIYSATGVKANMLEAGKRIFFK